MVCYHAYFYTPSRIALPTHSHRIAIAQVSFMALNPENQRIVAFFDNDSQLNVITCHAFASSEMRTLQVCVPSRAGCLDRRIPLLLERNHDNQLPVRRGQLAPSPPLLHTAPPFPRNRDLPPTCPSLPQTILKPGSYPLLMMPAGNGVLPRKRANL